MVKQMMKKRDGAPVRVGIISSDKALVRKIELVLLGIAEVTGATFGSEESFDLILLDRRVGKSEGGSHEDSLAGRSVRIVDRTERCEGDGTLPYPFAFSELRALVKECGASAARLIVESDGRNIILDGKRIRLTEREHALISAIAEGKGEFVSREELRVRAFGKDADGGILNVYVHYLREKLEGEGEKIILSSRLGGYRIDEKYLGVNK